jgi:hypothetical protein
VASEPKPATATAEPVKAAEPAQAKSNEPEVKTVSLDSLPVLTVEEPSKPAPATAAPVPAAKPHVVAHAEAKPAPAARKEAPAKAEKPEPVAKAEPKPEPKAKPSLPPPSANDSPLKAAIRAAIIADGNKK